MEQRPWKKLEHNGGLRGAFHFVHGMNDSKACLCVCMAVGVGADRVGEG